MAKETNTGLRVAVEWLANLHVQKQQFSAAADLMECEACQAVAVALGRDPMEVAYKVASKISEKGKYKNAAKAAE